MYLEQIKNPGDIKKFKGKELEILADEIRSFLIDKISVSGGHLASNLGVVELTMALHLVYDLPGDKMIWDVGHQSYTHKILTGRAAGFDSLRTLGGLSGFPKRDESDCDAFDTGHSSTSVSAGLGYVRARELRGEDYQVVSIIGDGALTGGMAYEAINNAAGLGSNFTIVLNDNEMSISKNVGGLSAHLEKIRASDSYRGLKDNMVNFLEKMPNGENVITRIRKTKSGLKQLVIPGMIFEQMGLMYLGPVNGHDIEAMVDALETAKKIPGPVIVHVITKKGKGYIPAERHPSRFHGTGPFEIENGLPKKPKSQSDYTDVFSTVMKKLGERNEKVVAVTAAMEDGTGLKRFHVAYPDRFFDVGIAEQHAVTFCAGLAAGGLIPIFAVYSSFLQRAFDQIVTDVCLQNLPVVFAIDRAGLVGSDGDTHQGIFDISYMCAIPNMTVMAPKNKWELSDMLKFAVNLGGPVSIRYPRGTAYSGLEEYRAPVAYGKCEEIKKGERVLLFALGSMVKEAVTVSELLKEKGIEATLVNARFAKPVDTEYLKQAAEEYELIVPMEENVFSGGLCSQVEAVLNHQDYKGMIMPVAISDTYVEHGNVELLKAELSLDAASIAGRIISKLGLDDEKTT